MARPRRFTIDQVDWVRAVHAARRQLIQALKQLPTLEQLAEELGVSLSSLKLIAAGRTYRQRSERGELPK